MDVYRLSERLADAIYAASRTWPAFDRETLGRQMVRAADSIGANIAEGAGRGSYADNCRFIDYARGSLYEIRHFLRRAHRRGLLSAADLDEVSPIIIELSPRLNAYRRSIAAASRRATCQPKGTVSARRGGTTNN